MKFISSFTVLLGLSAVLSANAGVNLQPGLWEIDTTMKSKSGNFEKMVGGLQAQALKNMPPEHRKMYQDSLAQQGIIKLDGGNTIIRDCITKEQVERMGIPKMSKGCAQDVISQTGNNIKLKFKCTGQFKATGEGEFKAESPKAYTITSHMDAMLAEQMDKLDVNSKGKWLSSDCGNIKPSQRD